MRVLATHHLEREIAGKSERRVAVGAGHVRRLQAEMGSRLPARITYSEKPASATLDSQGTETISAAGVSPMYPEDLKVGDFLSVYASAPIKIDAEYSTAAETHNPIELFSTTCVWEDDQLTVYEPTQNVYGFKAEIAKQLQIDEPYDSGFPEDLPWALTANRRSSRGDWNRRITAPIARQRDRFST